MRSVQVEGSTVCPSHQSAERFTTSSQITSFTFGLVQSIRDSTSAESFKLSFIFFQAFTKLINVSDKF
jgi:hypothetical protein